MELFKKLKPKGGLETFDNRAESGEVTLDIWQHEGESESESESVSEIVYSANVQGIQG